ncbi:Spo0E family sporulation regulatory protein-aspartic acid phosphatase [Clostridium sp. MCC353]|uniref:aspartyl-phosphate phosphatase Spo0E family protein n=1 Tax=Clostridium sp. MCC353 TaxID=2592646 RepID=UPI001C037BAB|nr:aspartyl-phosphate phosphatase Spo0E family protein [Clostridium sp. MCC353]MBT9779063.1 Spo0E family sporulation regulatory protein-aspartic acid phosphatase [Clostridium sp. MCC353]
MTVSKEELITKIEEARQRLNNSIDSKKEYEIIYKYSVELDLLIEQYMVAGY